MFIKAFLNNNNLKSYPKSRSQLHQRAHAELHIYKYLLETFAVVNGTQLYIFDFEFHVALLHQSYHRNNRKFLSLHNQRRHYALFLCPNPNIFPEPYE